MTFSKERKLDLPKITRPQLMLLFLVSKKVDMNINVFRQLNKKFLLVDHDPDVIDDAEKHGIPYIYGDATDLQLLEEINLEDVKFVVAVITDHTTNVFYFNIFTSITQNVLLFAMPTRLLRP